MFVCDVCACVCVWLWLCSSVWLCVQVVLRCVGCWLRDASFVIVYVRVCVVVVLLICGCVVLWCVACCCLYVGVGLLMFMLV